MDILTVEEVAQRLRLNPFTIRRLLREGVLRGIKVGKRQWRVRVRDLEAYLGQRSNSVAHIPNGKQTYPQESLDIEAADLAALLARVTPENRHELVDWGAPVGNEVW